MFRFVAGALIVVAIVIAIVVAIRSYQRENQALARQIEQMADLNAQIGKLQSENVQLKAALDKVQSEEERLVRDNEALRKAIEQAKLTGKVPPTLTLPYPPK